MLSFGRSGVSVLGLWTTVRAGLRCEAKVRDVAIERGTAMNSKPGRRRWLLVTLVAVAVATGGIAYASIPDAGGVIHSCYTRSSGAWRVIDTNGGQTCRSNELALDVYSKGGADALFLGKTEAEALFLGKAEKAVDSDKLNGLESTAFLGANAKAADSDKLDGLDSIRYLRGLERRLLTDLKSFGDNAVSRSGYRRAAHFRAFCSISIARRTDRRR
jgi:hypothetical protein